ncbi:MAG: histidine ammonia-lyase [Gammaproteobacteria bacterium]|nr:histidine ammonia-lyase [Gammaproteobacteria bacterium]
MLLEITQQPLKLNELRQVWSNPVSVRLDDSTWEKVAQARSSVEHYLQSGKVAYGINTGFGKLASVRISNSELQTLQKNLIRSHAVGVGNTLPIEVVRLAMVLKIRSLAQGFSGVSPQLIQILCDFLKCNVVPVVPSKGSVGASGDLAPLAHIAMTLIGEGEVFLSNQKTSAERGLSIVGIEPIELAPKEGISLTNGTEVSTALALSALFKLERIFGASLLASAMSTDAIKGSTTPFDEKVLVLKKHKGQQAIGRALRRLLIDSEIRKSHLDCDRVQDPYSIRCIPQVLGACLDVVEQATSVLTNEANSVSDNPIVFASDDNVLSSGNFHAESVAMVADQLAVAIAEIGSISERRIALLMDENLSRLPSFLTKESGLNSGFMMAQVTAAALVSENKGMAHPASVDSIPTSANQEDHVSMATYGARRLHDMLDVLAQIISIELLAAAQGIEFHRPLQSSERIEQAIAKIRIHSARLEEDRSLAQDIECIARNITDGEFCELFPDFFDQS